MTRGWEQTLRDALSSPALWDEGVEAARNACVAGAPLAAAAITAAAFYDNPLTGVRAVLAAHARFGALPQELGAWRDALKPAPHPETEDRAFVAGFGFVSEAAEAHVLTACARLREHFPAGHTAFFLEQRRALRAVAGALNAAGMCALAFVDARLHADDAERHYLLLRMEPALAAAQRAKRAGLPRFPFFEDGYRYEGAWPLAGPAEPCTESTLNELRKAVGLE